MNVLVILIPVSLVLGALGLVAFLWSLRANQYEDLVRRRMADPVRGRQSTTRQVLTKTSWQTAAAC